jgi:pyridoxal phosphate enzyme (YggS family)
VLERLPFLKSDKHRGFMGGAQGGIQRFLGNVSFVALNQKEFIMGSTARNLVMIQERIAAVATRVGRNPSEIKMIAVSKGRSMERILEASEAGQLIFGENRAQELRDKLEKVDMELEWHFIGHLQRNKVNMVVGKVALIHSVDNRQLAEAIDSRAKALGITQEVLLQVNVSGEESKYGVSEGEAPQLLETILTLSGLRVRGLMTIAPLLRNKEEARPCFRRLCELMDTLVGRYQLDDLVILSMGMTQDFEIAVEEGANMVRIGTAIFAD